MSKYDFLIVGSGFAGAVCARELTDSGFKCLVIDRNNHVGGNCYTEKINNINVHKYGAHIFHTSNKSTWEYVNRFSVFNNYNHHVVAKYNDEIYSLPFNMFTFNKMWGVITPDEAISKINSQKFIGEPKNLEEQALSLVGYDIYEKLIKEYTEKQWKRSAKELPAFIIKRLPVRFTYNNNYYTDIYQGVPINGYTSLFLNLLSDIDIVLGVDFFDNEKWFSLISKNIIFTGEIDKYYKYKYGKLGYISSMFEEKVYNCDNVQGHTIINHICRNIPYTRTIEHKHFCNDISEVSIVTREYTEVSCNNPSYPINDDKNSMLYEKYKLLNSKNTFFCGRLAEYKYYDMDKVIESSLNLVKQLKQRM